MVVRQLRHNLSGPFIPFASCHFALLRSDPDSLVHFRLQVLRTAAGAGRCPARGARGRARVLDRLADQRDLECTATEDIIVNHLRVSQLNAPTQH